MFLHMITGFMFQKRSSLEYLKVQTSFKLFFRPDLLQIKFRFLHLGSRMCLGILLEAWRQRMNNRVLFPQSIFKGGGDSISIRSTFMEERTKFSL